MANDTDTDTDEPAPPRSLVSRVVEVGTAMSLELAQILALAVIFPITVNALGPDDYGVLTTIYVIAGLAITVVFSAACAALVQMVVQQGRNAAEVRSVASRQVVALTLPGTAGSFVIAIAIFGAEVWTIALGVLVSELLITGLASVNGSLIFAVDGTAAATRVRLVVPVGRTIAVLVLFATDHVTLGWLVVGNVGTALLYLVVTHVAVSSMLARAGAGDTVPDRELRRYSRLYAAAMSANVVQNEGEKIALAVLRPVTEVGEYQAAYRAVSLILIPLRSLNTVATRWFLPRDERPGVHVDRSKRLSVPIFVYGVLAGVAMIVARPIFGAIVGSEFTEAETMIAWLAGFPLLRALADVPTISLLALDRNSARTALGVGGAAFALVCYFALIPLLGWRGAVIGTYLSEVATLIGGWVLLVRYQRIADERAGDEPVATNER